MSELTLCNFCTLRRIRKNAKTKGNRVILKSATYSSGNNLGGTDVFVLGPKERMSKNKCFITWFMALSDHCVC